MEKLKDLGAGITLLLLFGFLAFGSWSLVTTVLGPVVPVSAQTSTVEVTDAYDYEAITVGATAVSFTNSKVSSSTAPAAKLATCTLETNPIRYLYHGGTPTTSDGHPVASGTSFSVYGTNNIIRFRAIRSTGSDGTLRCTYSR